MDIKKYTFECDCHNKDHQVQFQYYVDDDHEELDEFSVLPLLNENPYFWQRLIIAFRYIFRLDTKKFYYHFDSVIVSKAEMHKFRDWINSL